MRLPVFAPSYWSSPRWSWSPSPSPSPSAWWSRWSRSTRRRSYSAWAGSWVVEPGVQESSSSSPVSTCTRQAWAGSILILQVCGGVEGGWFHDRKCQETFQTIFDEIDCTLDHFTNVLNANTFLVHQRSGKLSKSLKGNDLKILQTWCEVIDMRIQNFSVPPQEVTEYLFTKIINFLILSLVVIL